MRSESKKIIIGSIATVLTLMAPWTVLAQGAGGTSTKSIPPRGILKVPVPVSSSPQPATPPGGISGWQSAQPAPLADSAPQVPVGGEAKGSGAITLSSIGPDAWEKGGEAFTRMLGTIVVPLRSVWALVHLLFSGWEN